MEDERKKIAAIVVTYNRKELLKKCLDVLLTQTHPLDSIIILDNASTDGTGKMLREEYLNNPIFDYLKLRENLGGAGGFYYGIKKAYEKEFNWLWLMDDDVLVKDDTLENLLNDYLKLITNHIDIGMIGSIPIYETNDSKLSWILSYREKRKVYEKLEDLKEKFIEVDSLPFNSVLLKRDVVKKIGLPEKGFFIWLDDVEYCCRIREKGMKIFLTKSSIVFHPSRRGKEFSLFGKGIFCKPSSEPPWKDYYGVRNTIFLIKMHKLGFKKYLRLGESTLISLLVRDKKIKRAGFCFKGFIDGILNRGGRMK